MVSCMKYKQITINHNDAVLFGDSSARVSAIDELNQVAKELNQLAKSMLPDGVLSGILTGCEPEIRQDGILMALGWRFRDRTKTDDPNLGAELDLWSAPRALSAALRFTKKRYISELGNRNKRYESLHENIQDKNPHHYAIDFAEWPQDTVIELIRRAIEKAVRAGKLSPVNGLIATQIYVDGKSVSQVSAERGVHRSAINQRIRGIRTTLKHVADTIELPYLG